MYAFVVSKRTDGAFVPHEFCCLNHSVLSATHNYAPPTGHTHFTLRQQPQASVQLRNDMLQKGGCGLDIIYTAFQFAMREVKGHISTALVVHVI